MTGLPVNPKLRTLDIRYHTHQGQPYFLLRDPTQITDTELLVPQPFGPLLALCDGSLDLDQLTERFSRRLHTPVDRSLIEELIGALDSALMLETERYRHAVAQKQSAYRSAPHRPPTLAGRSYPEVRHELWQQLQSYLEAVDAVEPKPYDWSGPVGLLSPHIDYQRGGNVYAQVWKRAAQLAQEAEVVIIFGTDHYGSDPFTLTRQHYATPYGTLPTDSSIVDALAAVIGEEQAFAGELRHIGEHSLELVAVWLHHMRAGEPCPIVPILCGGFHRFFYNEDSPQDDPIILEVMATLRRLTAERRTLVVASGDLAHVGPAFGGEPLNANTRSQLRQADDMLIGQIAAGDVTDFYKTISSTKDKHNVCGVAPIYLTMETIGAKRGEPVGYATCPADDYDTSVVTIGGMIFESS